MVEYAKPSDNMRYLKKYWYLMILVLFCLTPLLWFLGKNPGVLINGLDTNFPLDPLIWFGRRFFVWNNIVNAGSDFGSSSSGMFFHLIQVIPALFGLSLKVVQIISLVFWFSMVVISSSILARLIVPKNKAAQIILVLIYSYNVYLFNTWENVKVSNLSLVSSLPIFVAIVYYLSKKLIKPTRALIFLGLASILASGSGVNPAYFSVIVFAIIITTLVLILSEFKSGNISKILLSGTFAIVVLVLINSFWILPLTHFLFTQNTGSLADIGLTDWLSSLSANTSLMNVVRLQGAWDWYIVNKYGLPEYLPYTLNYLSSLPFITFSFVVPVLALFSFIFAKRQKSFWYLLLGILMILGIFLGAGSHPPTGQLYLFLTRHLPFFSFYRSPWYIFTPLLTLSYAGLAALLVDRFSLIFASGIKRLMYVAVLVIFFIGYGLYNYPLITGKIFRPGRSDSFYVKFPEYVWQTKDWLAGKDLSNFRVITYPDDQLEVFKWGYRGTESILNLFFDIEVITPSFNIQSKVFSLLLDQFFNHLKRGEYQSGLSMLGFFGADKLFIKNDVVSLAPPIDSSISKWGERKDIGEWTFLSTQNKFGKIFSPVKTYVDLSNSNSFVYVAPLLGEGAISVNGTSDTVVGSLKNYDDFLAIQEAALVEPGENQGKNIQTYFVEAVKSGKYNLALEKKFTLPSSIIIRVDGVKVMPSQIKDKDGFIAIGPRLLEKGKHYIEVVYPAAQNLVAVGNYHNLVPTPSLRESDLPDDSGKTLVAFNDEDKEKEIIIPVSGFNPYLKYLVAMDYKYFYGSVPIIDIIQSAPTAPVKTFPLYVGSDMDWGHKEFLIDPVLTQSKLEFILKLPPNKPGDKSKTFMENISVKRIYDNRLFIIEEEGGPQTLPPTVSIINKSPVKYQISIKGAKGSYLLAFLDNYSKDWILKRTKGGKTDNLPHFTVNGYANGWYIPKGEEEQELTVYYRPQTLFLIGLVFSLTTIILSFLIGLAARKKSR